MKYILCYPNSKRPDWTRSHLSWGEVEELLSNNPHYNIGLLLGPTSGVIDIDCDGPEATELYHKLFGDIKTSSWAAKRGNHYLYQYDDRLSDLPAKLEIDGLEYRLGTAKTQSICPPSTVDGVKRTWINHPDDVSPAKLPNHIVELLLTHPRRPKKRTYKPLPELHDTVVNRVLRYCKRVNLSVLSVREYSGATYIDHPCPFKHPDVDDGNPAFIVNADGSIAWYCFHAKCTNNKLADVEKLLGPIVPTIKMGTDLDLITQQTIQALEDQPNIYQRGRLVEIVSDAKKPKLCLADNGAPQLRPIPAPTLKATLSSCAQFQNGDKKTTPPQTIVDAILSRSSYPNIPVITGIVSSPILRADGTIASKPGYDELTGLYLDVHGDYPPLMDVDRAIQLLDDVICDFPFSTEQHRSAMLANLVSMFARPAYEGPTPLFLYDGNTSRVGKGLATDLISTIFSGCRAARYSAPNNDDELRKLITSIALAGSPYLLFDNIKGTFGGATLENAITAGRWSDRILGQNQRVDIPLSIIWMGTSNNAALTRDMVGRTCHIRLETDLERPDLRSNFKHPNLIQYIKKTHKALAMAALSIPAQYIKAGRPDQKLSTWGGFEGWSDLVRNSLVWAGLPDPDTRDQLIEADDETPILEQLLDAWSHFSEPTTTKKAIDSKNRLLLELLTEQPGHLPPNKMLGLLLRTYRGRVLGRRKIERTNHKIPKWFVQEVIT